MTKVSMLYRRSLKTALSWLIDRSLYNRQADKIRASFEANRDISDPVKVAHLIENTEKLLLKYEHPDPYIAPPNPGGSKYQRNTPPAYYKESAFVKWY